MKVVTRTATAARRNTIGLTEPVERFDRGGIELPHAPPTQPWRSSGSIAAVFFGLL